MYGRMAYITTWERRHRAPGLVGSHNYIGVGFGLALARPCRATRVNYTGRSRTVVLFWKERVNKEYLGLQPPPEKMVGVGSRGV